LTAAPSGFGFISLFAEAPFRKRQNHAEQSDPVNVRKNVQASPLHGPSKRSGFFHRYFHSGKQQPKKTHAPLQANRNKKQFQTAEFILIGFDD
jgi:hypothetical protein